MTMSKFCSDNRNLPCATDLRHGLSRLVTGTGCMGDVLAHMTLLPRGEVLSQPDEGADGDPGGPRAGESPPRSGVESGARDVEVRPRDPLVGALSRADELLQEHTCEQHARHGHAELRVPRI